MSQDRSTTPSREGDANAEAVIVAEKYAAMEPVKWPHNQEPTDLIAHRNVAIMLARALLRYARSEKARSKRKYYFKDNACKAQFASEPDCICWHDEGTGPLSAEEQASGILNWREQEQTPADKQRSVLQEAADFLYMAWGYVPADTRAKCKQLEDALRDAPSASERRIDFAVAPCQRPDGKCDNVACRVHECLYVGSSGTPPGPKQPPRGSWDEVG